MFIKRLALLLVLLPGAAPSLCARDFLTEEEIGFIQSTQHVDARVNFYLDAADRRLRSAAERLTGKEPEEGDPLEFFTAEDMLDGYSRIIRSVMFAVDDAFHEPKKTKGDVPRALKTLKDRTENLLKRLSALKRLSEEKQKEALWNLVNQADEITQAAHDGAEEGIAILRARESR